MLVQIRAKHFVAALVLEDDVVVEAAPILRYMTGWTRNRIWLYCKQRRWWVSTIPG